MPSNSVRQAVTTAIDRLDAAEQRLQTDELAAGDIEAIREDLQDAIGGWQDALDSPEADGEWHEKTQAERLDEMAATLDGVDPEGVEAAVLVVTTEHSTDLLPAVRDDVPVNRPWLTLASHLNHVAESYPVSPETAAQFAAEVARAQSAAGPPNGEVGWR